MLIQELKKFLSDNNIHFEENVDLKKRTWIHRGGNVLVFIKPKTKEELFITAKYIYKNKIPFEIIGHTSNTYFKNEYAPLVVIATAYVNHIEESEHEIICDCGVSVRSLSKQMIFQGVSGFEGLIDLPGTVAASIYNNSSCFNCSISNLLISFDLINEHGEIEILSKEDCNFSYRSSILKNRIKKGIILSVKLNKNKGNKDEIVKVSKMNHQKRILFQQSKSYNLGSCFNNFEKKSLSCVILKIVIQLYRFYAFLLRVPYGVRKSKEIKYLLTLTGYRSLFPYVSPKSINCFMWIDENADKAFEDYCKFMKKMYPDSKLEIEIKS